MLRLLFSLISRLHSLISGQVILHLRPEISLFLKSHQTQVHRTLFCLETHIFLPLDQQVELSIRGVWFALSLKQPGNLVLFSRNTEEEPNPNSWDERIIQAGRTSGALQPKLLLKQGQLWCWTKLLRALSSHVFKSSRDGDCTASLSNLSWWVFLIFSLNFSCFNLCPLPLLLLPGFNTKSLAPSSW